MADAATSPAIPSILRKTPPDEMRKIALLFSRAVRLEVNQSGSPARSPATTPASLSSPASISSLKSPTSASLPKKVVLEEWWLVKSETSVNGKRLGVGGTTRTGTKAFRGFCSAPIVKRHNACTLETADGITVRIEGIMNSSRAYQNGFCQEACCIFMSGFPVDWEVYADGLPGIEDVLGSDYTKAFNDNVVKKFSASSGPLLKLDKIPPARIVDYLLAGCIDSVQECINFVANKNRLNDDHVNGIHCSSKEVESSSLQPEGKGQHGKDVDCGSECINEVLQQSFLSGKFEVKQELETESESGSLVWSGGLVTGTNSARRYQTRRSTRNLESVKNKQNEEQTKSGMESAKRYQPRLPTRRSDNLKKKENEKQTTVDMESAKRNQQRRSTRRSRNLNNDESKRTTLDSLETEMNDGASVKNNENEKQTKSGMESAKRFWPRLSTRRSQNLRINENEKQTTLNSLKTEINEGAPVAAYSECSPMKCNANMKKSHGSSKINGRRKKRRRL